MAMLDCIAEMLAFSFDCPCNLDNYAELMTHIHSEEWFTKHCQPYKDGSAVNCWKEILRIMLHKQRISKDEYYLEIAKAVAKRSTCLHRQYGAVIVNNDEIISTGYNGAPRGEVNCCDVGQCYCDTHTMPIGKESAIHGSQYGLCVAVHAEQNAIISASRKNMQGATLYLACLDPNITSAPCNICDRMIKNAGIAKVITK